MKKLLAVLILGAVAPAFGITFPDLPYAHVATSGDYLLAFTKGLGNCFILMDRDGEILLDSRDSDLDYEAFFDGAVTPDGRNLALLVYDGGLDFILIIGPDGSRREFKYDDDCGPPIWDSDGNFWYTAVGLLYKNGEPTGHEVKGVSISISPDGRFMTYAEYFYVSADSGVEPYVYDAGAIHRLDLDTGAKEVVADDRTFIAPFYATTGHIIADCWEGEVWLFEPDGEGKLISEGIHPAWCAETGSVLFVKAGPESDRTYVQESEIWLYELAGNLWQMTDTPDVAETWPVSWRGDIVAVENESNELTYIKQEW